MGSLVPCLPVVIFFIFMQEAFLNSPLQEERNFRPDCYGLPAVCDLFACMQLKVDKEKWLYRTPLQVGTYLH
jgi:hypothetical protein